jgi:hypothetical protein
MLVLMAMLLLPAAALTVAVAVELPVFIAIVVDVPMFMAIVVEVPISISAIKPVFCHMKRIARKWETRVKASMGTALIYLIAKTLFLGYEQTER